MNVMVRVTAPFLAAQLTFKTLLETLKNKRYACTTLMRASCQISFNQRCSARQTTLAECWWVCCEALWRSCSPCHIILSTHVSNKTTVSAVPHRTPHLVPLFPHVVSHQQVVTVPPQSQYSPQHPHYKWECVCNFNHPSPTVALVPSALRGPSVHLRCSRLCHSYGIACLLAQAHLSLSE